MMIIILLMVCLCLTGSAWAADPVSSLPGLGVCTHFLRYPANTNVNQMLSKIGARYVRDYCSWQRTEKVKGTFQLDARMSAYIEQLNASNIKPILILCYSNPIYTHAKDDKTGPNNPETLKAFGDYVSFLVSSLKGKVYAWEIWNEPDHPTFWQPAPNSKDYSRLVNQVAPIIRQNDPKALIVAGALFKPNWEYLTDLKEISAFSEVDVISFHWYTHPRPPEQGSGPMSLTNVRSFIQEIKRLGKRAWITEMGYPTSTDRQGVSEGQQADYQPKQLSLAASLGVEVCFIYDLIDDGPDPGQKEHRYGLFRQDGSPKSAALKLLSPR